MKTGPSSELISWPLLYSVLQFNSKLFFSPRHSLESRILQWISKATDIKSE